MGQFWQKGPNFLKNFHFLYVLIFDHSSNGLFSYIFMVFLSGFPDLAFDTDCLMHIRRLYQFQPHTFRRAWISVGLLGALFGFNLPVSAQDLSASEHSTQQAVLSPPSLDAQTALPQVVLSPPLSIEKQKTLLSQGLTHSLLHGTLEGLTPVFSQNQAHDSLPKHASTLQETWQSWLLHYGKQWLYALNGNLWHKIRHPQPSSVDPQIIEMLVTEIGMTLAPNTETQAHQTLNSTSQTPEMLGKHVFEDKILFETLVSLYTELEHQKGIAQDQLLSQEIDTLFAHSNDALTPRAKLVMYMTLLPELIEHARLSNAPIPHKKLTESMHSLGRLLQNSRYVITCRENASPHHLAITFDPALLMPGTSGAYQLHTHHVSHDRFPATQITCHIAETQAPAIPINAQMQQAIDQALAALLSKDNDVTTTAMHRLNRTLRALGHTYKLNATWNKHWHHAPTEKWLCQLQTITLHALDQHRFAEMAELDRGIQKAFSGSTFYQRLIQLESCQTLLFDDDLKALILMTEEYRNAYDWVIQNYAPKMQKKFSKNFSKWTRKVKRDVALSRRLLAAWTSWSNGDYLKAANYAGPDITHKKSRVVHPQLHSFDLVLKAIRKDEITREFLETYINVIMLKNPTIVYQTLTEAYPWLDEPKRQEIVEIIRPYSPAQASPAAASFYLTYAQEFRPFLEPKQRAAMGSWLESELHFGESAAQTQARRQQWLKDIQEAHDSTGFQTLMQTVQKDWDNLTPQAQAFWSQATL